MVEWPDCQKSFYKAQTTEYVYAIPLVWYFQLVLISIDMQIFPPKNVLFCHHWVLC